MAIDNGQPIAHSRVMENGAQSASNGKARTQFKPGNPGGPGRKRKPPEVRELERLTRAQVQEQLDRMVGPALQRLLKIVEKSKDDATVYRSVALLLDRTVGAVPSAQYLQAHVTGGSGTPREVISQEQVDAVMLQRLQRRGVLPAD